MAHERATPPAEPHNSYFYSCLRLSDKRWRPFSLVKMVFADPGRPVLESPPRPQPRSPSDLFWSFTWLALQGFGGVLAVVQRELVEKKQWMTNEEFVEDWAVAQIMPGPNVVNLSIMIGDRYFGLRGAFAALAGMLTFPLMLVLALAVVYAQFSSHPAVAGALRGMGAVAAGLIAGVAIKLFASITRHPLGRPMCVAFVLLTIVTMAVLRWPLWWILPVVGGAACLLTWRKLAP
jgi:chromate transporter